jgi:Omp85 superfamily domain
MPRLTVAQLAHAGAEQRLEIADLKQRLEALQGTAKPKSNYSQWIGVFLALCSLVATLAIAEYNRQWQEAAAAKQQAVAQASICLSLAQFAAQQASGKPAAKGKALIEAIAHQDRNCDNIEELASAFLEPVSLQSIDSRPNRVPPVRLSKRFSSKQADFSGYNITGVGPRVLTAPIDETGIGGRSYFLGPEELELPLELPEATSAKDNALRPSVFVDTDVLYQIPKSDEQDQTTRELKPRMAAGIGVNWDSPFGPFRIDLDQVIVSDESDGTKLVTFNVGTQF